MNKSHKTIIIIAVTLALVVTLYFSYWRNANTVVEKQKPNNFTEKKFKVETLVEKGFYGFDLEIDSNGKIYTLSRVGTLIIFDPQMEQIARVRLPLSLTEKQNLAKVADFAESEGGTGNQGLALDEDFTESGFFYVYSAYKIANHPANNDLEMHPGKRRITAKLTKYQLHNDAIKFVKVFLDNIPASVWHTGGRLEIGPDNKLYLTTGDGQEEDRAKDLDFLGGKILRFNLDGTVPDNNPFKNSYVYTKSHRNPQGLAWNKTGQLFSSEHGITGNDEINVIVSGGDYGWPEIECKGYGEKNDVSRIDPVFCTEAWTLAPSGIDFVNDSTHPWDGWLFVAGLRGRHVHAVKFDDNNKVTDNEIFFVAKLDTDDDQLNLRMRDVEFFESQLYILADKGALFRITATEMKNNMK